MGLYVQRRPQNSSAPAAAAGGRQPATSPQTINFTGAGGAFSPPSSAHHGPIASSFLPPPGSGAEMSGGDLTAVGLLGGALNGLSLDRSHRAGNLVLDPRDEGNQCLDELIQNVLGGGAYGLSSLSAGYDTAAAFSGGVPQLLSRPGSALSGSVVGNGGPTSPGSSPAVKPGSKVFVGGLSWETSDQKLRQYFENYGEVVEAFVSYDKNTGRPRGFGFVVFAEPHVADKVVSLQHTIDRREVRAIACLPRSPCRKHPHRLPLLFRSRGIIFPELAVNFSLVTAALLSIAEP